MGLLDKLFARPRAVRTQAAQETAPARSRKRVHVFWPDGERQHFTIDVADLDQKLLGSARNVLFVLTLQDSVVRASLSTGGVQTVTRLLFASGGTQVRGVKISASERTLVVAFTLAGCVDVDGVRTALANGLDKLGIVPSARITSVLDEIPGTPEMPSTVLVVPFGARTDAVIDEAFGLGVYLSVAPEDEPAPATRPA